METLCDDVSGRCWRQESSCDRYCTSRGLEFGGADGPGLTSQGKLLAWLDLVALSECLRAFTLFASLFHNFVFECRYCACVHSLIYVFVNGSGNHNLNIVEISGCLTTVMLVQLFVEQCKKLTMKHLTIFHALTSSG